MIIDKPRAFQLPALRVLWKEAFGDSEAFLDAFWQTAFAMERCRCVTVGDTVASALYWFDCSYSEGRVAYLYAIATARSHRHQGLCRALMEETHRHLKALGYGVAVLVPGSRELFDFYQKIGYQFCSRISEFSCIASSESAELRAIGISEYAKLRRRFLPKDGIVQENENLEFLQTQAAFYAADGFLLAARQEKGILYGTELLGDTAAAPAIVRTLGCSEGRFRIPGTDMPFAMCFPLTDGVLTPPAYFGLAFD